MWEQGSWRWREKANLESFLRIATLGVASFVREGLVDLIHSLLIVTIDEFYLTMVENAKSRMQETLNATLGRLLRRPLWYNR